MDNGKSSPVTLKTIADEVGISVTAVSKALRGEYGVSSETQKKVKETAERLNYRHNSVAQSLRTNSTGTLGLIVSDSSFSFFTPVIEGVERAASENKYNIILCNASSNVEKEKEAVKILLSKRVDGLLLAASLLNRKKYKKYLDSLGIPYVFLVRRGESDESDFVINDNVYGSYQIVNFLIGTGSRNVFFINIHEEITSYSDRQIGYEKALRSNGLEVDPSMIYGAKPTVEDGYAAMSRILKENPTGVDAVFCGCDVIAIGAMEAILDSGRKIPQDIRVAGYDDIEYAAYLRVPLTTVRQPKYKIGKMGTEVVINRIKGNFAGTANVILRPDLVLREST